jgi:hypothetical protein
VDFLEWAGKIDGVKLGGEVKLGLSLNELQYQFLQRVAVEGEHGEKGPKKMVAQAKLEGAAIS